MNKKERVKLEVECADDLIKWFDKYSEKLGFQYPFCCVQVINHHVLSQMEKRIKERFE